MARRLPLPANCHLPLPCTAAAAAHGALCVFHLGTARRVATIPAHAKNVRALCYDGAANALLTCSFDRSVKVFAAAEAVEAER